MPARRAYLRRIAALVGNEVSWDETLMVETAPNEAVNAEWLQLGKSEVAKLMAVARQAS